MTCTNALGKRGILWPHSDESLEGESRQRETHSLGTALAAYVLQRHFDSNVAESFFIVAYNPYVRLNPIQTFFFGGWAKRHHMQVIGEHFDVPPEQLVIFDDTKPIVMDCVRKCNVQGVHVSPKTAFVMSDVIDKL